MGKNGFERLCKTLCRHFLYDRTYYDTIEKKFGQKLKWDNVDVRMMNACCLDFPDNHFDYIFSNAVFEHISDLNKTCHEINRVLKNDGCVNIGIHLYPSLSGGHNFEWSDPDTAPSKTVLPWDHLRQNLYPSHAYLNKLCEKDYSSVFNKYFSIIDSESSYEGEKLLTDKIMNELSGQYSKTELLKKSVVFTMKKKK